MLKHHYREANFLRKGERLRDIVFGYNDGSVATLVVITAFTAANVSSPVIILGALASIFGTGIAMMFSDYISVRSQMTFMRTFSSDRRLSKSEKADIGEIVDDFDRPMKIAMTAFGAFIAAGFIALVPFLVEVDLQFGIQTALFASVLVVMISVFVVGFFRARYTKKDGLKSGLEMVGITSIALATAYAIGVYGPSLIRIVS